MWKRSKRLLSEPFWRSVQSKTNAERKSAKIKFEFVMEMLSFLSVYIEFPKLDIPSWDIPNPLDLRRSQIEGFAGDLRRFWGMSDGPIGNMTWLLESKGIIVTTSFLDAIKLDAASDWSESDTPPIVLLNRDAGSTARSRFDIAHELGHILLHRSVDRKLMQEETEYYKIIEKQAHTFAASFLFPSTAFRKEVVTVSLDHLLALKHKWKLSVQMMVHRADDIGMLSDHQKMRLWKNLSARGWRSREPLDDQMPPEEPMLLLEGFKALFDNGVASKSEVLAALPFSPSDLEQLCGANAGFFDESAPSVRIVPIGRREN
jgi:Zn-dependent peptidase ImmA (M78 family)